MSRYRLTISQDDDAESPAAWDNLLELHFGNSHLSKYVTYGQRQRGDRCAICEIRFIDHPTELDMILEWEHWDEEPHFWERPADVAAYVMLDQRGPYSTIHEINEEDFAQFRWGDGIDVHIGALIWNPKVDPDWADLPPEPTVREVIEGTLGEWRIWLEGRVWCYLLEEREFCPCEIHGRANDGDHWVIVDTLSGIYASAGTAADCIAYAAENSGVDLDETTCDVIFPY